MRLIGEKLTCAWPSVTKFYSESALRHTSPRCDTLSDRCVVLNYLPTFGLQFASAFPEQMSGGVDRCLVCLRHAAKNNDEPCGLARIFRF